MKKSLVMLVIAAVVAWLIWWWQSSTEEQELSVQGRKDFHVVDTNLVDSIEVRFAEWAHLGRGSGEWLVWQRGKGKRAAVDLLSNVIKTTNGIVLENLITTQPSKFSQFQVDTLKGNVIRFFSRGEPLSEFVIGKIAPDFSNTYMRGLYSDSVYLARGQFQGVFTRKPSSWRDHTLWEIPTTDIDTVIWERPDDVLKLTRNNEAAYGWTVASSKLGKTRDADSLTTRFKLDKVARVITNDYPQPENPSIPGFDNFDLRLTVVTTRGERHGLWVTRENNPNVTRYFGYLLDAPEEIVFFFENNFRDFNASFDELAAKSDEAS